MLEKLVNRILSLGERKVIVVADREYENGPAGILPIKPPKAETLEINTLTGIVDFYGDAVEELAMCIHVVSHKQVNLIEAGFTDNWLTRSVYIKAEHQSPVFPFGRFLDVEDFIINLQAMFVQDETTAAILKVVGNLKDEAVTNFADDGITQAVSAKAGISTVAIVPVPNPVTLRPFRTFMEVEQPASTFILRMKSGKGFPPSCALFEADGRMWSLEAIKNIKAWLETASNGVSIIA